MTQRRESSSVGGVAAGDPSAGEVSVFGGYYTSRWQRRLWVAVAVVNVVIAVVQWVTERRTWWIFAVTAALWILVAVGQRRPVTVIAPRGVRVVLRWYPWSSITRILAPVDRGGRVSMRLSDGRYRSLVGVPVDLLPSIKAVAERMRQ